MGLKWLLETSSFCPIYTLISILYARLHKKALSYMYWNIQIAAWQSVTLVTGFEPFETFCLRCNIISSESGLFQSIVLHTKFFFRLGAT
jgi:hypothetical protein